MWLQMAPACADDVGSWCARIWSGTGMGWLAENIDGIIRHGLRVVLIIVIALVVRFLARRAINRVTSATADGPGQGRFSGLRDRADSALLGPKARARRAQRAKSIGSLLNSVTSFVIFTVALILVLAELGINVGPLLASAGIAGIALGFGAQNLVRDFISGIFMLLEDQYGVGDIVDVGEATGTVVAVGLRTTTVRALDGVLWYVRNGEVLRVGNFSQGEATVVTLLPLSYRADVELAGRIALQVATEVAQSEEFAAIVTEMPDLQGVVAMTNESVSIRMLTSVQAGQQWAFGRAVDGAVKKAFDEAGIPAPASDLQYWSRQNHGTQEESS